MSASGTGSFFRGRAGLITLAAAAGAIALVVVGLLAGGVGGPAAADVGPVFTVAQGPLTISVEEAGTITAREQVVVKSQVEGRPTIIYLIDEGVHVEKGDLLVQLDSSGLESDLLDQEIKVQNAQAALIQAEEALAVANNQATADVAQAKLDFQFAQQDLVKYLEGEYPMALMEAETNIRLAEEELKQADQTFQWSQQLFDKNYLSANELEKDRLALKRAELEHRLAVEELKLLEQYTKKREIDQLESDKRQAELALDRTIRSAKADVVKAESDLRAKQLEFNRQSDKFAKIQDQIAKCRITAPTAGMVVYATTGRGGWRNQEPLAEGQDVREREELIKLPTASAMSAEIKIHESSLDKVAVGQPVRVTIDALPGRVFSGTVTKISPLPDAQSVWLNPDLKVYDTTIELAGDMTGVRTGMTCRAEVIVDHYPDAVYVPVQSVVRVGDQPTVYVPSGGRLVARPIELGLNNNRMARVLDGLKPGELVSLTPPLAPARLDTAFESLASRDQPADAEPDQPISASDAIADARAKVASSEPPAPLPDPVEPTAGDAASDAATSGADAESGS